MCELDDDRMEEATRSEMHRIATTQRAVDWIMDALGLDRADEQARKIAEAARLCREADEEESE